MMGAVPPIGRLAPFSAALNEILTAADEHCRRHGRYDEWLACVEQLPAVTPSSVDSNTDAIRIGRTSDCSEKQRRRMEELLQGLHPWRKGPFDLFGIRLETEWRSDWKWNRFRDAILPLAGRTVLDVGCGSGYHCWRMRGAGAAEVVGIDPSLLFCMQFRAVQHYVQDKHVHFWPVAIDALPASMPCFDTIFSMGVIYHRRDPLAHLRHLQGLLLPGGELVLETLVVEGDAETCLTPDNRYAKMGNVRCIPSVAMAEKWLGRCNFRDVRTVDVSTTSTEEQRSTDWMRFESLPDYLDPGNPARTVEGYPAPKRAIFIARNDHQGGGD